VLRRSLSLYGRRAVELHAALQVLARFEGFPSKKLEALRTAAALYSKLDGTASRLQCWKHTAGPVSAQLDRLESYFNKVRSLAALVECMLRARGTCTPTAHAVRCAGAGGTDEDTAHGFDDVDVAACRSKTRWTW
jgi:hypothetical protein